MAGQPGFFDLSDRYAALSAAGDPLEGRAAVVWFDGGRGRWIGGRRGGVGGVSCELVLFVPRAIPARSATSPRAREYGGAARAI